MGQTLPLKRLVLDTNVLVSSLLFTGPSNHLPLLWQSGVINLLASAAIIQEYARVLAYPKFELTEAEVSEILNEDLLPFITPVRVNKVPDVIKEDPFDNQFLACAVEGQAQAIVSGDHHLLNLASYQDTPVITLRSLLDTLGAA